MTDIIYTGMNKDEILEKLSKGAEESGSGLLVAKQQMVVRRFNIVADHITVPTLTVRPENPNSIEGDVTELELKDAGMNVEWLLHCGAIEEVGSTVVASAA